MDLRLRRWWHRDAVPAGRHARVLPLPSVPGAASTLVSSAGLDPRVTGLLPPTTVVVPAGPDLPLSAPEPWAPGEGLVDVEPEGLPWDPVAVHTEPPAAAAATAGVMPTPAPDGRHDAIPVPAVGLVFSDGASVELGPDDPRVRTFRAAAAALLDPSSR